MARITIDLDDKTATALNRWISRRAAEIGPPHPEPDEIIGALVVVMLRYADVGDAVCSQIRHQRSAAGEHGQR